MKDQKVNDRRREEKVEKARGTAIMMESFGVRHGNDNLVDARTKTV